MNERENHGVALRQTILLQRSILRKLFYIFKLNLTPEYDARSKCFSKTPNRNRSLVRGPNWCKFPLFSRSQDFKRTRRWTLPTTIVYNSFKLPIFFFFECLHGKSLTFTNCRQRAFFSGLRKRVGVLFCYIICIYKYNIYIYIYILYMYLCRYLSINQPINLSVYLSIK